MLSVLAVRNSDRESISVSKMMTVWLAGPAWPWQSERETDLRRAKAKGATVLAHRLRLYLALHEGADPLDGRSRFRKDPRPHLPGVRHPRPYFEFDLTSGGAHPLRHAHGIIEEDLVAADLDERRRQSARVGVKRRRIRRARIGAGKIIAREPRALRASQHRIGLGVSLQGTAGEREIGPGRKRDGGGRQMKAFVTQLEQHRQDESARRRGDTPGEITIERRR